MDSQLTDIGYAVEDKGTIQSSLRELSTPHRKIPPYIRVPVAWIVPIASLSLCALRLGLAMLHLRGLRKSNTFRLSLPWQWKPLLSRNSKARALHELEAAGLVSVKREKGMMPVVILQGVEG